MSLRPDIVIPGAERWTAAWVMRSCTIEEILDSGNKPSPALKYKAFVSEHQRHHAVIGTPMCEVTLAIELVPPGVRDDFGMLT